MKYLYKDKSKIYHLGKFIGYPSFVYVALCFNSSTETWSSMKPRNKRLCKNCKKLKYYVAQ